MINYLNLTSGLEFAPEIDDYKLVRIQSSHFEANAMWSCVSDLDYGFLIDAATAGVTIYDCGSRRGEDTRAQWKGIPWINWVYARANNWSFDASKWQYNWISEFEHFYAYGQRDISPKAKSKLRYVGNLTGSGRLKINCVSRHSTMDGKTEMLAKLAGINRIE